MTKIKMCGMRRECDIKYVNEIKPDYIGFIFAKGRTRYIEPEKAYSLRQKLADGITTVGVFLDEEVETVISIAKKRIFDMIQLHGNEDETYISKIRENVSLPIIKVFSVKSEKDIIKANASSAEYVLLDYGNGGTGKAFDWSLLDEMKRDYFLAGGLDVDNAGEAVRKYHPYAVDVSSGIETDGMKDEKKMIKFASAVRAEE